MTGASSGLTFLGFWKKSIVQITLQVLHSRNASAAVRYPTKILEHHGNLTWDDSRRVVRRWQLAGTSSSGCRGQQQQVHCSMMKKKPCSCQDLFQSKDSQGSKQLPRSGALVQVDHTIVDKDDWWDLVHQPSMIKFPDTACKSHCKRLLSPRALWFIFLVEWFI